MHASNAKSKQAVVLSAGAPALGGMEPEPKPSGVAGNFERRNCVKSVARSSLRPCAQKGELSGASGGGGVSKPVKQDF